MDIHHNARARGHAVPIVAHCCLADTLLGDMQEVPLFRVVQHPDHRLKRVIVIRHHLTEKRFDLTQQIKRDRTGRQEPTEVLAQLMDGNFARDLVHLYGDVAILATKLVILDNATRADNVDLAVPLGYGNIKVAADSVIADRGVYDAADVGCNDVHIYLRVRADDIREAFRTGTARWSELVWRAGNTS